MNELMLKVTEFDAGMGHPNQTVAFASLLVNLHGRLLSQQLSNFSSQL